MGLFSLISMALSVFKIAMTIFGLISDLRPIGPIGPDGIGPREDPRTREALEALEALAKNTQADVDVIKNILLFEDFDDSQQAISIALSDFVMQIDGRAPWSVWKDWAGKTLRSLDDGALNVLHQITITPNEEKNIIKIFKKNVESSFVSEKQTLTRRMAYFMYQVQSWQAMGYNLVFQANRILSGPQGNNWDYIKMVQRINEQSGKFSSVLDDIDDSGSYLVSSWERINCHCTMNCHNCQLSLKEANYAHLGDVVVDEGHVVIGFKFYVYGNRLAIKLKQGVLNEIGVITQAKEEWKYPVDPIEANDIEGERYIRIFDDNYDRFYLDLSFVQAEKGSTIVGVKFCLRGNRMGICIKTKKVDFSTGALSGGKWSAEPWSEGNTNTVNYWMLGNGDVYSDGSEEWNVPGVNTQYVDAVEVVSDPPAMLTGVGMWTKVDRDPWKFQLRLKARDIFEFDGDRSMNCDDGNYPYFGVETDDKTAFACCNGYLYNKTAQICLKDENDQIFKPYFIDCGDTPVPKKDQLECANGDFADIVDGDWNGCLEKNSYRFRCPYPYIPCQQMREVDGEETLDFWCDEDCSNYGGKRKTSNGGKMHIYILLLHMYI